MVGHADVGLGLLEEVDQRQDADHVDELMQPPPADAAELAHHAVGRGEREHAEADQGGEADGEIDAQRDLAPHRGEVEHLVHDVKREMRHGVAECPNADHAAQVDQARPPARKPPQRRDRQRQQQKHQGPEAGAMNEVVDRTRTEADLGLPRRDRERDRPDYERERRDPKQGHAPAIVAPELTRSDHDLRLPQRHARCTAVKRNVNGP